MSYPDFDDAAYLLAHPDVAEAVRAGTFASGREHYELYGRREGRTLVLQPASRSAKVLSTINPRGKGLEIGPSHNPIMPKAAGFDVDILDHLDRDGLRRKYQGHNVDLDRIEEVDFVWSGENLVDLTGRPGQYDWIVASHVIEHTPDLVSFLQQCQALLAEAGRLALIVPDKRYCFDHFGPVTTTGAVLDAHHEGRIRPSPGQVFDHLANAANRNGAAAWSAADDGPLGLIHPTAQAANGWSRASTTHEYLDVHCWRFVPESFSLIISDLRDLGLLDLGIVAQFDTVGCEFYVTLGKEPAGNKEASPSRPSVLARLLSL